MPLLHFRPVPALPSTARFDYFRPYFNLPRPVYVLCLGTLVNRAGSFFVIFLTIYLSDHQGYSARFATLCMGVFGLGSMTAAFVGGQLADVLGRRIVMLISLTGGAIILALFGHVSGRWAILAAILAFALVIDMYRPAASAMIGDLCEPGQRSYAFGLVYIAINLGFWVGATVGGLVVRVSYLWLFYGDALTSLLYAGIIALFIRETLPRRAGRRGFPVLVDSEPAPAAPVSDAANAGAVPASAGHGAASKSVAAPSQGSSGEKGPAPAAGAQAVPLTAAIGHMWRDTPFVVYCAGCLIGGLVFMQGMSTLPLYMKSLGIGADSYSRVISLNGAMIALGQLPLTAFLARFDRLRLMAAASVMIGAGFGMTALAGPVWQFALTVIVWTLGEMMQASFSQAIVADMAPAELRGRYMGVFSMCFSSAVTLGAPLGGQVLDRFGGHALWAGCLGASLVAAGLFLAARRIREKALD